jgi:hypothetical protein
MTDLATQKQLAIETITPLAADANAFMQTAEGMTIETAEQAEDVVDLRRSIQLQLKKVKAAKTAMRKPIADGLKEIDSFFKPPIDQLEAALRATKEKLDEYARVQASIAFGKAKAEAELAREAETAAKKAADELRKSGADEVADVIEKQASMNIERAEAAATKTESVRGKKAQLVTVRTWKAQVFSVKDICKAIGNGRLPTDLVDVNMKALNEMARTIAEEKEMPGFTVYQHISTQTK